ncbi:MAG: hypothetical protein E7580_01735 [Ruminococcaceae bacterium]|nr:hypothetical protein [Oscillospiraceae bacterium]
MKTKMKFLYCIAIAALAMLVALSFSGCTRKRAADTEEAEDVDADVSAEEKVSKKDSEDAKNEKSETEDQKDDDAKELSSAGIKPNVKEPVLSPESAVEIYMANKDLWMENPEFPPMAGYGYCLLDLDFDGVLELINSVNDGSMRLSTNKYFRIDLDNLTVETIAPATEDEMEGIDYSLTGESDGKLVKNRSNGKMFYIFSDYTRVTFGEAGEVFYENYMKNGKMYEKELSFEYVSEEKTGYTFRDEEVSEAEYEKKYEAYYKENQNMNLVWEVVDGEEFDKASIARQTEMLLSAYKKFSYDGFSFNKLKTYDVEVEKEDSLVRLETHYFSTVKDNFSKGYEPKLVLNKDGTFVFVENLAAGMGTYRGTYQILWDHVQLLVTETDFSGFAGDDVKLIDFIIKDPDTLTLNTELCMSFPGDVFSTAAP